MCYQHYHECSYCNLQYECELENYVCPTINYDEDRNMCDLCRVKLEQKLNQLQEKDQNENS